MLPQMHATNDKRGSRRFRLSLIVVAVPLGLLSGATVGVCMPYVRSFGPQGAVGDSRGDIHRHDSVEQFGWPFVCVERYFTSWWVYSPSGSSTPTDEQKRRWLETKSEDVRRFGHLGDLHYKGSRVAIIERWERTAEGNYWIVIWPLLGALATCWVFAWAALLLGTPAALAAGFRWRRKRAGLCPFCGYDLRASREFGRCPECGTPIEE